MFSNKKPSRLYCSIAWVSRAYFFFMIIYLQYPFVAIIHYTFRFFLYQHQLIAIQYEVFSLSIKFWSTSTSTSHILCIGFLVVFVLLTKKALFTQILLLKSGWKLERIYHVISIALNLSFFPHTIITSRLCNTNSKAGYTRLIS